MHVQSVFLAFRMTSNEIYLVTKFPLLFRTMFDLHLTYQEISQSQVFKY